MCRYMRFRKRNRGCFFAFNAYNILNKGAGRIACTYPFRRYVLSYRITVQPLAGEWTVILRLLSLTSVMIAQSMMTKVNKSEYVTIACPPSARSRNGWQEPSNSSLGKYIKLSMYLKGK